LPRQSGWSNVANAGRKAHEKNQKKTDRARLRKKLNTASPTKINLTKKQYDAFVTALDAPVKPRPRLEKLLATPSVLDQ